MMTGFELAILLAGASAMVVFAWSVQKLCDSLTHLSDRNAAKLEKIHVELISIDQTMRSIKESFQYLDKN